MVQYLMFLKEDENNNHFKICSQAALLSAGSDFFIVSVCGMSYNGCNE